MGWQTDIGFGEFGYERKLLIQSHIPWRQFRLPGEGDIGGVICGICFGLHLLSQAWRPQAPRASNHAQASYQPRSMLLFVSK